jgi:hypothetical protein
MKRAFILLTTACLLLGGCVRYSNGKPVEEEKAQIEQKEEKPKTEEKTTNPKNEEKKQEINQQATNDLKEYIEENFSETTWGKLITDIEVKNDIVTVNTDVFGDEEGKNAVKNIDNAVWSFTNSNDSKYKFKKVNIRDKDGKIIISEDNPLE